MSSFATDLVIYAVIFFDMCGRTGTHFTNSCKLKNEHNFVWRLFHAAIKNDIKAREIKVYRIGHNSVIIEMAHNDPRVE